MRSKHLASTRNLRRNIMSVAVLAAPSQLLTMGLLLSSIIYQKRLTRSTITFALLVGCALIASINSTRILEADLYNYSLRSQAIEGLNFFDALEYSKEYVYYIGNWAFLNLFGLDFRDFFFVVSFFIYFFSIKAIENYYATRASVIPLLHFLACGLLFITSPVLFEQSSQLVRQYLAMSLALYGVSRRLSGRTGFFWVGAAIFTHVSAVMFLLAWVPVIISADRSIILRATVQIALLTFVIGSLLLVVSTIGATIGIGIVAYGVARLTQETFHQLLPLGPAGNIVVWIHLILSLFLTSRSGRVADDGRMLAFALLLVSLDLVVIVSGAYNISEISVRFAQFSFFSLPFLFVLLYQVANRMLSFCFALVFLQMTGFILRDLRWQYDFTLENLLLPAYLELLI